MTLTQRCRCAAPESGDPAFKRCPDTKREELRFVRSQVSKSETRGTQFRAGLRKDNSNRGSLSFLFWDQGAR